MGSVNFNPNNMPLSMRNGVKKPAGNIDDMPKGKTDRTSVDANQLFGEAQAAQAAAGANDVNGSDVMRGEEKNFNNWKDFDKEWDKGKIEEGDWGTVGKEQYVVIKREDGTLDVLVHDPDDSMGPKE